MTRFSLIVRLLQLIIDYSLQPYYLESEKQLMTQLMTQFYARFVYIFFRCEGKVNVSNVEVVRCGARGRCVCQCFYDGLAA